MAELVVEFLGGSLNTLASGPELVIEQLGGSVSDPAVVPQLIVEGLGGTVDAGGAQLIVEQLGGDVLGPAVADAGQSRTVPPLRTFVLDGSGSYGATSWSWDVHAQSGGPPIDIADATSQYATVLAPATYAGYTVTFRLTIQTGATSDVTITVDPHDEWIRGVDGWLPLLDPDAPAGETPPVEEPSGSGLVTALVTATV